MPCPPPGDLPTPGIKPRSPALQVDSLLSEPPGETKEEVTNFILLLLFFFFFYQVHPLDLQTTKFIYAASPASTYKTKPNLPLTRKPLFLIDVNKISQQVVILGCSFVLPFIPCYSGITSRYALCLAGAQMLGSWWMAGAEFSLFKRLP